jgi:phage tail-like protein
MTRAAATDFLHSMRFHVTTGAEIPDTLRPEIFPSNVPAGFMSCTTPEATTEAVEYREGHFNYPQKYPGNTTVSDITLQKGVTQTGSNFWNWLRVVVEGSGDYRTTVSIKHFNRSVLTRPVPITTASTSGGMPESAALKPSAEPSRIYNLYEAFPIRAKVAGDLDASSSDISVSELDIAFEYFDVVDARIDVRPS